MKIHLKITAFLALVSVILLAGCARAPVAPVANIYGYQRLAIVPFENNTQDPALQKAVQDQMTDLLLQLNAVVIVDAARVGAYLKSINASPADVETNDAIRQKLAAKFKCDIIMTGACQGYTEFLKDEAPKKLTNPDTGAAEWGFYTNRKVVVDTSARILEAENGGLIWSQKGNGYSWLNTWNPLPIPASVTVPEEVSSLFNLANLVNSRVLNNKKDVEPIALDGNPDGKLIYPKSAAFADLRNKAIYQSVSAMTDDFRGSHGWVPGGVKK